MQLDERDGRAHAPSRYTVTVRGGALWRSPRTGLAYPSLWQIVVPGDGLDLTLEPVTLDQELAGTGATFWTGAVDVIENPIAGAHVGTGRVELTGYGEPLRL